MKLFGTLVIALLMTTVCVAQPNAREYKISNMLNAANQMVAMASLNELSGNSLGADDARRDGLAKLENLFPDALEAAKGSPDLVQAVKAYYLAGKAYLGSSPPRDVLERAASLRLKADMEAKSDALELEMKLAGLGNK